MAIRPSPNRCPRRSRGSISPMTSTRSRRRPSGRPCRPGRAATVPGARPASARKSSGHAPRKIDAVTVDLGPYLDAVPQSVVDRLRGARRVLAVGHENPDADTLGATLGVVRLDRGERRAGRSGVHRPDPAAVRLPRRRRAVPDRSGPHRAVRPGRDLRLRIARADRGRRRPARRAVRPPAAGHHRPPRVERRRRGGRLDRPAGGRDVRDGDHPRDPARAAARCRRRRAGGGAHGRHRHGYRDLRPPERDPADARRRGGAGRSRGAARGDLATAVPEQARRPAATLRDRARSTRELR